MYIRFDINPVAFSWLCTPNKTNLAEECEFKFILQLPFSISGVSPVQVYPIKPICSQKCDSRLDELCSVLLC